MRHLQLLALSLLLAVAPVAEAQNAIPLNTARRYEFTDCASGGSSAQTVLPGRYLMRVTDADVWMCIADSGATCATAGERFPSGLVMVIEITGYPSTGKSVACRSSGSNGDLILTLAQ